MKKITIKKNGLITNQVELSLTEANEWLDKHLKMETFGKSDQFEKQPILVSPAVYETQSVLIKAEVVEDQEVFDANGNSYDPPQYETVIVEPAIYEDQQVLVQEAVYETEQVLIKPAVYAEDGVTIVEEAIYETKQVLQDVLVAPAEFEIIEEDITTEITKRNLIKEKREKGRDAREACEAVLDLIAGFNFDRELTAAQIDQMQATFANPEKALRAYRPSTAKVLISNITPDDVLVTQEMKDLCIELLANY